MFDQNFEKFDFKEKYPTHYLTQDNNVVETTTQGFNYISISWVGHPEDGKIFNKAIQLLEGLIFTIKFKLKWNPPDGFFDFSMPPTESSWQNIEGDRKDRKRKVSLPVPDFMTKEKVTNTRRIAQAKSAEKLSQVKYSTSKEKKVIQVLHIWAYQTSKRTINKLHSYCKKNKLEIKSDYQELYLNDMRRTKPEKLETIIRYEVKKIK